MTVYATPPETPFLRPDGSLAAPIMALIDTELVRVTAISGTTWAIDRGMEATTAATHAQDAAVIIVPAFRGEYEGRGAQAAFGVIEGESYVPALSSTTTGTLANAADADCRGAFRLGWTPAALGTATCVWMIDPHTLVPDDYSIGEIDVEVFARVRMSATTNTPKITLSALPEGGSTGGVERFTREWGNVGVSLTAMAGASGYRMQRLGTLPLIVDRANPIRWRLKAVLSLAASGILDVDSLYLNVIRNRAASPVAKTNDTASASGTYPAFTPYNASWTTTSTVTTTVKSDGTALVQIPGGYAFPHRGMGRVVEIPDSDSDLLVRLSNLVPMDTTVDTTNDMAATAPSWTVTVHAAVTPRYALARGS